MTSFLKPVIAGAVLLLSVPSFAQYPTIPPALEDSADKAMSAIKKKSNEAWEKAYVIVKEEEKLGRPYKPWASKPEDLIKVSLPAFPGAEGAGAYTPGGRGGKVIVVTNLNDSGPGSFREACETGGARIIVFNVAGIIQLKSPVSIRAPYITIAGQTAPGDGICIAGESVLLDTHDIIIRFVRFRRGATEVTRRDDAIGGNTVGNIIIDHVSASWGLDENMSMYRHVYDPKDGSKPLKLPTVNITMMNCIFSEGLDTYNHAFGSTIGGHNTSFMRNLWSSNISRSPSVGMDGDFNFVNNVVFNWWNRTADGGDNKSLYNFINNYYKPGPMTPTDAPIGYRILKPEASREKGDSLKFGKAYVHGNIVDGNERVTKNNWDGGVQLEGKRSEAEILAQIKVDKPFPMPKITIMPAKEAYTFVLEHVGATLPVRDAVDKRIVEQVRTGKIQYVENAITSVPNSNYVKRRLPGDSYKKGIIIHPSQVGGYPEYKGTAYKDSDNDGIPDEWEKAHGLNPNKFDSQEIAKSGYAHIEEFLNSVVK